MSTKSDIQVILEHFERLSKEKDQAHHEALTEIHSELKEARAAVSHLLKEQDISHAANQCLRALCYQGQNDYHNIREDSDVIVNHWIQLVSEILEFPNLGEDEELEAKAIKSMLGLNDDDEPDSH